MANQYRDGSFGETRPLPEALGEFFDALPSGNVVALHVGTEAEIEEVKLKADLSSRIAKLEAGLEEERRAPSIITTPTEDEVSRFIKPFNDEKP